MALFSRRLIDDLFSDIQSLLGSALFLHGHISPVLSPIVQIPRPAMGKVHHLVMGTDRLQRTEAQDHSKAAPEIRSSCSAMSLVPGVYNLQNEPTHASHAARRRLWDPSCTVKAVRGYENSILSTRSDLLDFLDHQVISDSNETRIDFRNAMLRFGFDAMSKVGFGRSFDMLTKPDNLFVLEQLDLVPFVINTIGNVPYVMSLLRYLGDPMKKFRLWTKAAVDRRVDRNGDFAFEHADVFAYLIGEEIGSKGAKSIQDRETLLQDAMLLVVAGSDTTANTVTSLMSRLATKPDLYKKLQVEMDTIFPSGTEPDDLNAVRDGAVWLKACIYATGPCSTHRIAAKGDSPICLARRRLHSQGYLCLSKHIYSASRSSKLLSSRGISPRALVQPRRSAEYRD
ncbi:unnamed protein product [Sympodiomycopsis kandeliae]